MRKYEDIVNVAVVNFRQVWGNTESNLARIKGLYKTGGKARSGYNRLSRNGFNRL